MESSPVPTDFSKEFNSLGSVPAQDKPSTYSNLLEHIIKSSQPSSLENNLTAYISTLLGSTRPIVGVQEAIEPPTLVASRPLLSNFITRITSLTNNDLKASVAAAALSILQPRVNSFEEQDTSLKLLLADCHQADEDFLSSAKALQSINLDSTSSARGVTDSIRADIWVRIARCYLEEDDATSASVYINRAKNVLHNVSDPPTRLAFALSQARILDAQRAFLDASAAYHTVSFEPLVDDDDRLHALTAAITCAVLAPAGPARARTLAKLYKDERAAQVDEFPILEKMFLDRVLARDEVAAFAGKLAPHQLARTADGSTVLDRAVLQHNLLGASRLYRNIGIDELGALLGVDGDRAEQYAAQMIEQGRLAGHIDQIDRLIIFEGEGSGEKMKAGGQTNGIAGGTELRRWDVSVQSVAEEVERIATMIQTQYPVSFGVHGSRLLLWTVN